MRTHRIVVAGIAAALLVTGGALAAAPTTSGSCAAYPGDTTVNYLSKTTQVAINWYTDGTRTEQVAASVQAIGSSKPGSLSLPTPERAGLAEVLISSGNPHSLSFRTLCT
jgi:hypothetical protein